MKVEGTEAPIAVAYKIKVKEEGEECCGFQPSSPFPPSLTATTITTTSPIITAPSIGIVSATNSTTPGPITVDTAAAGAGAATTIKSCTETRIITTITPPPNVSRLLRSGDITSAVLLPSSSVICRASAPSTTVTMVNTSSESFSSDLDLKTKVPQVLPNGPSPSEEKVSKERRRQRRGRGASDEKNPETPSRENACLSPCSIGKTKVHQQLVNGSTQPEYARGGGSEAGGQYAASSGTESPLLSSHPIKPENDDSPADCATEHDETETNKETDSDIPISNGACSGPRGISGIFAGHGKLKRLLGTLIQFATNISHDTGDSVRTLVLGLLSGAMTAEEFHSALQEATNVPLRGFVLPYLRHTLPSLRRDINSAARSNNQTCVQYLQLNESVVLEAVNLVAPSSETVDLFGEHKNGNGGISGTNLAYPCSTNYGIVRSGCASGVGAIQHANTNSATGNLHQHFSTTPTNLATKRRASDTSLYENGSPLDDGPIYGKRNIWPHLSHHQQQQQAAQQPPEPYCWYPLHSAGGSLQTHSQNHPHVPSPVPPGLVQVNQSTSCGPSQLSHHHQQQQQQQQQQLGYGTGSMQNSSSLDDEWKNIHVMLNCILGMVEKTKRALAILQRRGSPSPAAATIPPLTPGSMGAGPPHNGNSNGNSTCSNGETSPGDRDSGNFKRLSGEFVAQTIRATEDKVAEVKRRAEEAVQEVKRAAVVEVQRAVAVAVAESRANERLRVHRLLDLPLSHRSNHGGGLRQNSSIRVASHINSTSPEAAAARTVAGGPLTTTSALTINTPDEKDLLHTSNVIGGSGCWNCGRTALETCGGCGVARYCGYFCQHRDWEAGGHHASCNSRPFRDPPPRSSSPSPPRSTTALLNSNDNDGNGASTVTSAAK